MFGGYSNVYVAGIPEACTEQEFRDFFAQYGNVTSTKLSDQSKNGTRYGFVNFTTPEEAYQAIQATNNMQFGPCVLTVRLANSSKGSGKGLPPGGSMGMSLGGFDGCPPSETLIVKGLSSKLTDEAIKTAFSAYGQVNNVKIMDQYEGFALVLVKMATVEQAEWVVDKVDGNIPHTLDAPVDVSFMPTGGARLQHLLSNPNAPFGDKESTSPATREFQKAVSDTIAGVKGFKAPPSGEDEADPSHLLIKGLAPEIDELYLYYVFAPFGAVQNITVSKDEYGGCTGTAYVKFGVPEDALLAVQTLCGNPLPDGSIMGVYVRRSSGTSNLKGG